MGTETTPRPQRKDEDVVALHFGPFELDLRSGELRRGGALLKLQPQPFKVLALLAGHPGELVTREEIQHEVWPAGTFVDFEQSLNFCIRQIRAVLGDSALTPRYIETLPRRGYRWIGGPVEKVAGGPAILEWRRPAAVARPALEPKADGPIAPGGSGGPTAPGGSGGPEALAEPVHPRPERPPRHLFMPLTTAGVLAILSAGLYFAFARRGPEPAPSFQRLTFRRGSVEAARFAPEGQVVLSAAWEGEPPALYASRLETRESRRVDMPGSRVVGVSRQGEVAYLKESTLARAPLAGGPPRQVLDGVMLADWTTDGADFLVVRRSKGPYRLEFPIGTVLCDAISPTHGRIAPDRQRVAFLEHPIYGDDGGSVVVVDRKGAKRTLSDGWASIEGLAWSPRSDEVWFTGTRVGADSALHAVTLDGRVRTVLPSMGRLIVHDIAPDGRVLIERTTLRYETRFRRLDEPAERDLSWLDLNTVEDLSPDGRTMLFMESGEGGGPDYTMFMRQTDGSLPVRLGTGRAMGLSPDGLSVLSVPLRERDRIDIVPTGAGETRTLRNPGLSEYEWAGFVPPDGRTIYYTAREKDGPRRAYLQDLKGGAPRIFLPEGSVLSRNLFTPDGAAVVLECKGGEPGKWAGLCLYPVDSSVPRPIPGLSKPLRPVGWDQAGHLYLADRDYNTAVVHVLRLDPRNGRLQPWQEIAPPDRAGFMGMMHIVIARSGQAFAYSYARKLADLYVVRDTR